MAAGGVPMLRGFLFLFSALLLLPGTVDAGEAGAAGPAFLATFTSAYASESVP